MVTVAVLAVDLATTQGWIADPGPASTPAEIELGSPALNLPSLPSVLAPWLPGGDKRLVPLPQPDGNMAQPMTFELVSGGKLMATGTITPGSSQSFAAEVGKRGDYVKTVVLNSPGGSVTDALAMGRLIRERKFATEVEAGKYCESSCPLVFAGGVERRAGDRATIGVHQVAALRSAANGPPREEMGVAQNITAPRRRYQRSSEVCHAGFSGNDSGGAAAVRGRLHVRLDADIDRRQRSGGPGQSHHRQLGRRGKRLECAEAARP